MNFINFYGDLLNMFKSKHKFGFLILLFFIVIVGLSCVSAADSNNTLNLNSDGDSNLDVSSSNLETGTVLEGSGNVSAGSFSDLNSLISADSSGYINLNKNYTYNPGTDSNYTNGISISKDLTINGNGFTVNGANESCFFRVENSNLVLNNLNFVDSKNYGYSGVTSIGSNLTIFNSSFTGNVNSMSNVVNLSNSDNLSLIRMIAGGALSSYDSNIIINMTSFKDNGADYYGGACYFLDSNVKIFKSNFTDNFASCGGALYSSNTSLNVYDSSFINNSASTKFNIFNLSGGGAISSTTGFTNINHCLFNGNSAISLEDIDYADEGGAVMSYYENLTVTNSSFVNNTAKAAGGAIWAWFGTSSVSNSSFKNNTAYRNGGAVLSQGDLSLDNVEFIDNSALNSNVLPGFGYGAGALYMYNGKLLINNTYFIANVNYGNLSNTGLGGAIFLNNASVSIMNSLFLNNIAGNLAGAIYANNTSLNITSTSFKDDLSVGETEEITLKDSKYTINYNTINGFLDDPIKLMNSTGDLNYNWWGVNSNPSEFVEVDNTTVNLLSKWVVMNFYINTHNFTLGDKLILKTSLNQYTDGVGYFNMTGLIPEVEVNYIVKDLNVNWTQNTSNNVLNTYYLSSTSGNYCISSIVDNENITYNITVNPLTNKSTSINLKYETFLYNQSNNYYTSYLLDSNGNPVISKTISLNLSNPKNGLWKVYNVTTNYKGLFSLAINLLPGFYGVSASFDGDNDYNPTSSEGAFSVNYGVLNTSNLNINSTVNENFNGTLYDYNNLAMTNQLVNVKIVRLSDGLYKTYTLTTNSKGEFSLPIHLNPGNYFTHTSVKDNTDIDTKINYITINNTDSRLISSILTYDTKKIDGLYCNLLDYNLNDIFNANLTIELTRNSDGASKNYTITNDSYGYYSLPINLSSGSYTYKIIYPGNSTIQACMYKNSFNI